MPDKDERDKPPPNTPLCETDISELDRLLDELDGHLRLLEGCAVTLLLLQEEYFAKQRCEEERALAWLATTLYRQTRDLRRDFFPGKGGAL